MSYQERTEGFQPTSAYLDFLDLSDENLLTAVGAVACPKAQGHAITITLIICDVGSHEESFCRCRVSIQC